MFEKQRVRVRKRKVHPNRVGRQLRRRLSLRLGRATNTSELPRGRLLFLPGRPAVPPSEVLVRRRAELRRRERRDRPVPRPAPLHLLGIAEERPGAVVDHLPAHREQKAGLPRRLAHEDGVPARLQVPRGAGEERLEKSLSAAVLPEEQRERVRGRQRQLRRRKLHHVFGRHHGDFEGAGVRRPGRLRRLERRMRVRKRQSDCDVQRDLPWDQLQRFFHERYFVR